MINDLIDIILQNEYGEVFIILNDHYESFSDSQKHTFNLLRREFEQGAHKNDTQYSGRFKSFVSGLENILQGETATKQVLETHNQKMLPSEVSKEKALSIFKDLALIKPLSCIMTVLDNREYIFCLANKKGIENDSKMFFSKPDVNFYKLSKFANAWRIEYKHPIFKQDFTYCTFLDNSEIVYISQKHYLYFTYHVSPMGNAINRTSLYFSLFSLDGFNLINLIYEGEPSYDLEGNLKQIKGSFIALDKFKNHQAQLEYLEGEASKSNLIYRASDQDLTFDSINNFSKKWQIDNAGIKSVWDVKENTSKASLNTTYYKKDIFLLNQSSVTASVENDHYKVTSFFRGNILGYDKSKENYFPIWVESCLHGCNKDISFLKDTILKINYIESNNEAILIDLLNMTYQIIIVDLTDSFKKELLDVLKNKQHLGIADIIEKIEQSSNQYDRTKLVSIKSKLSPVTLEIMAASLVESTKSLIHSIK